MYVRSAQSTHSTPEQIQTVVHHVHLEQIPNSRPVKPHRMPVVSIIINLEHEM